MAWIDACRAGAVVLVVFFHVCIWLHHPRWGDSEAGQLWHRLAAVVGAFRMPILVTVSGLLAGRRIQLGWRGAAPSLTSNAYLYAVWITIYALLATATPRPWRHEISSWQGYLAEAIRPTTTLWYVFALVVYITLMLVLRRVPTLLVLGALGSLSLLVPYLPLSGMWPKIWVLFFFFAIGVRTRDLLLGLVAWFGAHRFGAHLSIILVGGLFLGSVVVERFRPDQAWSVIALADVRGVLAALGCVAAAVLATSTRMGRRLAHSLGRRTLAIYVLHVLVIEALISASVLIPTEVLPTVWSWLAPPLITAAVVALCLAGERLLLATPLRLLLRTPPQLIRICSKAEGNDSPERPRDPAGAATF